jgi:pimeloyl-ACP methyl ester carboxylesterase
VLAHSDEGQGPPLVFLHGLGTDRTRWQPVVSLLGEYRCISVDLPGHGESADDGCDQLSAVTKVAALVEHLHLGPHTVIGHSLGASTALLYGAIRRPQSVDSIDPAPLYLPHLAASLDGAALRGPDFDSAFRAWEARFGPSPKGAFHPRQEVVLSYWAALLDDPAAIQPGFEAALAAIAVPTLVCLGDEPSPEDAAILATMSTTTVEVFDGLGHFLHLADPDRFVNRLRVWLRNARGLAT